ncbi:MAG: hypothetical protein ACKVRO_09485 [Micropepsaceae bacterium]
MSDNPGDWWDWFSDWDWGGGEGSGNSSTNAFDGFFDGLAKLAGIVAVPVVIVLGIGAGLSGLGSALSGSGRPSPTTGAPVAPSRPNTWRTAKEGVEALEEVVPEIVDGMTSGGGSQGATPYGSNADRAPVTSCSDVAAIAQQAYGYRWLENISPADAWRCGFTQPRATTDRRYGNEYYQQQQRPSSPYQQAEPQVGDANDCGRLIRRAKNRLGSRWLQELSAMDAQRCAWEIDSERRSGRP